MSHEDCASLVDFGLTVLQARTYTALLKLGETRASELSAYIEIVRPEIYRVLRELSVKGLVERSPGSPSTFTPTPPDQAVNLLLMAFSQHFDLLNRRKQQLTGSLASLSRVKGVGEEPEEHFGLLTGNSNVLQRLIQMISQAESDYVAITSKYGLERRKSLGSEFLTVVKAAKRRGVHIRVISDIDESNFRDADYLLRYAEVRELRDLLFYVDIVDKKRMLFGPAMSDEETRRFNRESDLWTNHPRFIAGMYGIFERLWGSALKFAARNYAKRSWQKKRDYRTS